MPTTNAPIINVDSINNLNVAATWDSGALWDSGNWDTVYQSPSPSIGVNVPQMFITLNTTIKPTIDI